MSEPGLGASPGWDPPADDDVYVIEVRRTESTLYEVRASSHEQAEALHHAGESRRGHFSVSEKLTTWRRPKV